MTWIALLSLPGVAVVAASLLTRRAPVGLPAAPTQLTQPARATGDVDADSIAVEIVHLSLGDGILELDCVVAAGEARGWPFALRLRWREQDPWSTMAARRLQLWEAETTVVDLRVGSDPEGPTVTFSHGRTVIHVDAVASGPVLGT